MQQNLDEQIILVADENGNFTGEYIPKWVGHTGKGKHHLAVSVFVYNQKGEILLQRRKHKVFDNIWDNTGSSHQLHREDGTDETDEEATLRLLKREYEIDRVEDLKNLGGFNYFAQYGGLCENEYCILLTAKYDGKVKLNPEVGYEYKWMDKKAFFLDFKKNPEKYTPWCREEVKILEEKGFFN